MVALKRADFIFTDLFFLSNQSAIHGLTRVTSCLASANGAELLILVTELHVAKRFKPLQDGLNVDANNDSNYQGEGECQETHREAKPGA